MKELPARGGSVWPRWSGSLQVRPMVSVGRELTSFDPDGRCAGWSNPGEAMLRHSVRRMGLPLCDDEPVYFHLYGRRHRSRHVRRRSCVVRTGCLHLAKWTRPALPLCNIDNATVQHARAAVDNAHPA